MDLQFSYYSVTFYFFLVISLNLIKKWKKAKLFSQNQKRPPGPLKLPFIGSLHHLIGGSLPHHILRDLAGKHGPLMHLQLGEVSAIVVSSPRIAEEVMKTSDLAFASRPETLAMKIVCYDNKDIAFCPYGEYWRQMRKICLLELLGAKNVRSFSCIRHDEASRLIACVQISACSGNPINLTEKISSYTSSMVCRAAFGKVRKDQETFLQLVKETMALAGGFTLADLFPSLKAIHVLSGMKSKLSKIHYQMDMILENIINEHMQNDVATTEKENGELGQEDLIDVLLRIKDRGELQFPITSDNIKAVIFDMFTAGSETSSATVAWALSEMVRNPRVMNKAQSEIRQVFKEKRGIDDNDIQELKYLKLVIKETLRMHPPFPLLLRESREDCEIQGYDIPMKTKVLINAWGMGRDAEYWKDPDCFIPERFTHSTIGFVGNNFQFLPFGAGRRMCPGMSFGLANAELPLALLLYHFNWELPAGVNELDMTESMGLTALRKNDLYLVPNLYDPSR